MAENGKYYNVDEAIPTATATPVPTVSVIAPSTLPEGYVLDAVGINGENVKVTVPKGGVQAGQQFMAPIVDQQNIPYGKWRDGLFDCCSKGPCHPSLCLSWWCAPLSLAQVMTRMKLNWCGQQKGAAAASKTWTYILFLFVGYMCLDQLLDVLMIHYGPKEGEDVNEYGEIMYSSLWWALYAIRIALRFCFFLYFLVVTIRTRQMVREKYDIPEKDCGGCEDCCCSYWCSCCTISQMSRHTADYDTYPAACCTKTGLNANAPQVV